jgi:hypothetical protein
MSRFRRRILCFLCELISRTRLFLVYTWFSCTLVSLARLVLVSACSSHLLRLIPEHSISILLNNPLAVFLALLWEEASLSAQRDLPNGPAILHRLRNCAPASPASQPPFPREEHERLEHDEYGHRNAESVRPYRYRVGKLQPVMTNREVSKAFWFASRDCLIEDVECRITS